MISMVKPPQIALFGTSADPPTLAHRAILAWLAERFDLVAVWAADNPFKPQQTPLAHRQQMLQLLVSELPQPQVQAYPELSDWRTLHTVERAQQRWPESELTLVIGTDVVAKMPDWYQIQQLLHQAQLLIVQRPDSPLSPTAQEQLQVLGARFKLADFIGPPLSSTALRQHYSPPENSTGEPTNEDHEDHRTGLTPSIAAYIQTEHLYPWANPISNPH
jgi:nicotinate-nucleotide adenylyltransferase